MSRFQPLPGFRDFYPADCFLRNYIFSIFRATAKTFGFEEYDGPTLEPIGLFTAKSGDEIVEQLFNFDDRGGRKIALRPEMTPSLARMIGEHANAMKRPIKWFNISEAFRYERPQKGRLRSFYQMNADLFGISSCYADAEVIALLIQVLRKFGLTHDDFHVRVSDRVLWALYLQAHNVTDVEKCLGIIDKCEREDKVTIIKNLNTIKNLNGQEFFDHIQQIKSMTSPDALLDFFRTTNVINEAIEKRVEEFSKLLGRLSAFGLSDFISVDFGIVRGLAYYTGFVFEAFERSGQSRALAGGGRYDDLISKLGYSDLKAVGFAIGDVTLTNLLKAKQLTPQMPSSVDCFVIFPAAMEYHAMRCVNMLRAKGWNVNYSLKDISPDKQLRLAVQEQAKYAITFGMDTTPAGSVRIKNLVSRDEKTIVSDDIVEFFDNFCR